MIIKQREITCPVHKTLEILGKRWTALVIRDLIEGKKRFGELQRSLTGVSPRILSQRLDELEEWGIIQRKIYPEVPLRVEYSLTPKGKDLKKIIDDMASWGQKWLKKELSPKDHFG